jgi:hypothetical protein
MVTDTSLTDTSLAAPFVEQQPSKHASQYELNLAVEYFTTFLKNCGLVDCEVSARNELNRFYPLTLRIPVNSPPQALMLCTDRLSALIDVGVFTTAPLKRNPEERHEERHEERNAEGGPLLEECFMLTGNGKRAVQMNVVDITHIPADSVLLMAMATAEKKHAEHPTETDISLFATLPEYIKDAWHLLSDRLKIYVLECMAQCREQQAHHQISTHGLFSHKMQQPHIHVEHPEDGILDLQEALTTLSHEAISQLRPLNLCPLNVAPLPEHHGDALDLPIKPLA